MRPPVFSSLLLLLLGEQWGAHAYIGLGGAGGAALRTRRQRRRETLNMSTNSSSASGRAATPNAVADSFAPSDYQPPLWARNNHLHTILGSGEVRRRLFGRSGPQLVYRRERLDTPDGDFLDVDWLDQPAPAGVAGSEGTKRKIAVLLHGLESSSDAPLTSKMALSFYHRGFDVAVLCFRGCSGEDNLGLGGYHLGFTSDVEFLVSTLNERHSEATFFLSGFSLGGNVIAKFLGELGDKARDMRIAGGAIACVPFDAPKCSKLLDRGFNRAVYSNNFLQSLIPKMQRKAEALPEFSTIVDMERVSNAKTLWDFDDSVIAPLYGFSSALDYYQKSGSGQFLKNIRVPLLAIQAKDDPFVDSGVPRVADAPVRVVMHEYGGHCGFVLGESRPEHMMPSVGRGQKEEQEQEQKEENDVGFLAYELARFAHHVDQQQMAEAGP